MRSARKRGPEDEERNFSCLLNIVEHSDPFQLLADEAGIARTVYFKQMLNEEFKNPRVLKRLKPEYKEPLILTK